MTDARGSCAHALAKESGPVGCRDGVSMLPHPTVTLQLLSSVRAGCYAGHGAHGYTRARPCEGSIHPGPTPC